MVTKAQEYARERRRAKAYIKVLQKTAKSTKSALGRGAIKRSINELNKAVAASYRGSGQSQEEAVKKIRAIVAQRGGKTKQAEAVNRAFQRQLGLASRGKKSSLGQGDIARGKVSIFYAATERMWQGRSYADRNKIIMQRLGVKTMPEAYQLVMGKQKEALEMLKSNVSPVGDTEANRLFRESIVDEFSTSSDFIVFVNEIR